MDRFSQSFPSMVKLFPSLQRARMLPDAIVEFIARDMRPVSVVDGIGFLNLMHVAELTPCRKTTTELIGRKDSDLKREIHGYLAQQEWMFLTTDFWMSKAGSGYISLTAYFVC